MLVALRFARKGIAGVFVQNIAGTSGVTRVASTGAQSRGFRLSSCLGGNDAYLSRDDTYGHEVETAYLRAMSLPKRGL